MPKPRYDVETYDPNIGEYTPQKGVRCRNVTIWGVRKALRFIRDHCGLTAHRFRDANGNHDDNDSSVYVSRRS